MLNRNQNSHFAEYPVVNMNRSQFDRTHTRKMTFQSSRLIPFEIDEILPGDTFNVDTSAVCRMATPIFPTMGEAYLDYYYFFVPTRLVWEHTEEFYGANKTSHWEQPIEYFVPSFNPYGKDICKLGKTADYMGIPVDNGDRKVNLDINALPFRAYGLIWNEWFRNENYQDPILINTGDVENLDVTIPDYYNLLPVNKYRDYFTSMLPSPQKGQPVTIPLGLTAPIIGAGELHEIGEDGYQFGTGVENMGTNFLGIAYDYMMPTGKLVATGTSDGVFIDSEILLTNMVADLSNATAATINQLRLAFQLQRILERDARYGTRFTEYLKAAYGVNSGDARLQRPEYLGGNRVQIGINQVIQASSSNDTSVLGQTGAVSKTVTKSNSFVHSFVEPGYLIGVCCVRYNHTYQDGLERMWSRKRRFDFYDPSLAHIGEQAVLCKELYAYNDVNYNPDDVLGYQEAFADYRYKPSRVCGDLRTSGGLSSWVYVDDYQAPPTISAEWIQEDPAPLANTLAITDEDSKQFIADICIKNIATRVMPVYSIPGLIDHF